MNIDTSGESTRRADHGALHADRSIGRIPARRMAHMVRANLDGSSMLDGFAG